VPTNFIDLLTRVYLGLGIHLLGSSQSEPQQDNDKKNKKGVFEKGKLGESPPMFIKGKRQQNKKG